MSFEAPAADGESLHDSYVSDPSHPVPYRPRPIEPTYPGPGWPLWLVQDQRFVHGRPDVLSFETGPLAEDVIISGPLAAHLFASTTGSDGDFVAKLIDVFPEEYPKDPTLGGFQLMIAGDVIRGRYRKGWEKPVPIEPGAVVEYVVNMNAANHRFEKGHRIMVQVQSTWFPLIDRNPQTFVRNIFEAKDADFRFATVRIFRSKRYPSRLTVLVGKP